MKKMYQLHALRRSFRSRFKSLRSRIPYKRTVVFLQKRPFTSFFVALGILLAFIILGNTIRSLNRTKETKQEIVKSVTTYSPGNKPTVALQATVEKYGVVKILAQTAGIVDTVNVQEGASVSKGSVIVDLSSNYQGADAPAVQAQLAQQQYQNTLDTYQTQKDLIATQRDLAKASNENADQLRDISQRSIGDTQELLRYNETMLTLVNQSIGNTPSDPQDTQFTNPLQQSRAQLLASVVQVRAQLRSLEQQADANRAPAKLANLQEAATLKQLDIQDKALDLQKEASRLQAALASINASLMRPSTPFEGVVQRVYVRPGQSVTPGTAIALVSQGEHAITALALVPYSLVEGISTAVESVLTLNGKTISLKPSYVSTDATDGQLYTIKYEIPLQYEKDVTDGQTISVSVPINSPAGETSAVFVPLDAVYKTQNDAFVYIVEDGKAVAKNVTLGNVYGRFVAVSAGITPGDTIILTRNIIENDRVKTN